MVVMERWKLSVESYIDNFLLVGCQAPHRLKGYAGYFKPPQTMWAVPFKFCESQL